MLTQGRRCAGGREGYFLPVPVRSKEDLLLFTIFGLVK